MQTIAEVRSRFHHAFDRYASAHAYLLALRHELMPGGDSAGVHGLNAQLAVVKTAEYDYRTIRLEYIDRLLPRLR
jgi:hypothetical protein